MKGFGDISDKQAEVMEESMKASLATLADDVPLMQESLFKEHLLPLLANVATGGKVDLGLWTDVAGTTFRAIDVIDPQGHLLYRVPPLHRQLQTEIRDRSPANVRTSANEIINHAALIAKNNPRRARAYVAESLDRKVPRNPIDMDRVRAFDAILKRYGYPGLLTKEQAHEATTEVSEATSSKSEIEAYDDIDF